MLDVKYSYYHTMKWSYLNIMFVVVISIWIKSFSLPDRPWFIRLKVKIDWRGAENLSYIKKKNLQTPTVFQLYCSRRLEFFTRINQSEKSEGCFPKYSFPFKVFFVNYEEVFSTKRVWETRERGRTKIADWKLSVIPKVSQSVQEHIYSNS